MALRTAIVMIDAIALGMPFEQASAYLLADSGVNDGGGLIDIYGQRT